MQKNEQLDKHWQQLTGKFVGASHQRSDYFGLIRGLLELRAGFGDLIDPYLGEAYRLVEAEIITNTELPRTEISFGTSGWRGILGKDICVQSVRCVTAAIVMMYRDIAMQEGLADVLGVASFAEAKQKGCLVGHDNRFGGEILGRAVAEVLAGCGFKVYYCGETTTGVLSAALLQVQGAFSVNLTPSHNPLEYGGYKYNAADGGPAAAEVTSIITTRAREVARNSGLIDSLTNETKGAIEELDSFLLWQRHVEQSRDIHRIDYQELLHRTATEQRLTIVIDAVHGASRLHLKRLFGPAASRLSVLRGTADVTFGGIAPEPSSANMRGVKDSLRRLPGTLKIGAVIDPDGDRVRFCDGEVEISMNQFGAMAYYFLHENKLLRGLVAKTVATSNLANAIAKGLNEEVFEPRVGFKEFKPVIGKALVCFEESDGISIIGHTPEKDAYIGILLALDMVLSTGKNLGGILRDIESRFGGYYPDRDSVTVSRSGKELAAILARLAEFKSGSVVRVGGQKRTISRIIDIDGWKMIFDDESWLMIRPSGTEPKVRFYVESRSPEGTGPLVQVAREMLADLGLL